jgi:hypothetical protein
MFNLNNFHLQLIVHEMKVEYLFFFVYFEELRKNVSYDSFVTVLVNIFLYIPCNYGSSRMTNRITVGLVRETHLQKPISLRATKNNVSECNFYIT